jgi:hypothetical protein
MTLLVVFEDAADEIEHERGWRGIKSELQRCTGHGPAGRRLAGAIR